MQCYDSCDLIPARSEAYIEENKCVLECSEDYGLEVERRDCVK
jgi:hypothetical protein